MYNKQENLKTKLEITRHFTNKNKQLKHTDGSFREDEKSNNNFT